MTVKIYKQLCVRDLYFVQLLEIEHLFKDIKIYTLRRYKSEIQVYIIMITYKMYFKYKFVSLKECFDQLYDVPNFSFLSLLSIIFKC